MKDYYQILGIPQNADADQIKSAFRKLAFEHHPDRNPGDEAGASERFKQINEAYSVLGDEPQRRRYDAMRSGRFAGVGGGHQGFGGSREDIFSQQFSGQDIFAEIQRMFAQMGLRFDEDMIKRGFHNGDGNAHFRFYSQSGDPVAGFGGRGRTQSAASRPVPQKPNFLQRQIIKLNRKVAKFLIKRAFGVDIDQPFSDSRKRSRKR